MPFLEYAHVQHDPPDVLNGVPDPRWEALRQRLCAKCIFYRQQAGGTDESGRASNWLIDLRILFLEGEALQVLAEIFWERYQADWPFQIVGMEAGSIPLLTAILLEGERRKTPITAFWVRKERKPLGRMQLIEGNPSKDRIILIDDILNSGNTSEKLLVSLHEAGLSSEDLFVVVNYGAPKGDEWLAGRKVRLTHLFDLCELGLQLPARSDTAPQHVISEVWRFRAPDPNLAMIAPKSTPLAHGDALWFGSDDGSFWSINKFTGRILWRFRTRDTSGKGIMSSPAIHNGLVYFGAYDGNVYCLDANEGVVRWRFSEAGWVHSSPAIAAELGVLFIGLEMERHVNRGLLVALDLETGRKRWEFPVREFLPCSPLYLAEQGLVVTGSNEGRVYAVRATDGSPVWQTATNGAVKQRGAYDAIHERVLFGSFDGGLYAIALADGSVAWRYSAEDAIFSSPLIVGSKVFIGSHDKHLHVISLIDGAPVKCIYLSARITARPVLMNGAIFVGTFSGQLISIDPVSLEARVEATFPDRITTSVVHDPETDLFFVSTFNNRIHAVRRQLGTSPADPA